MSKNKNKNPHKVNVVETLAPNKVKMRFKEHKYYNDLHTPMFEQGKVYELEGAEWIQRWLKRGGEIVEGELSFPEAVSDKSELVQSEVEQKSDNSSEMNETVPHEEVQTEEVEPVAEDL